LFCPPPLPVASAASPRRPLPAWLALYPGGFAARLARSPVDLVTALGMARANAYYAAGFPEELCEHAAARDLWRVIYQEAIGAEGDEPKEGL
jgi:hypothetical protein